ncbi:MAG TPA: hypothetical protein VM938_08135 [Acidimicrobiales bacterium]|nr:hypothetical protein [Acidimicrobiales bacterium]
MTSPRIIVLWSTPRSVSTAFEKAFAQHPQVTVLHEPFTDCYYFGPARRSRRYGDCPGLGTAEGKDVVAAIEATASPIVFVKELAFQGLPYVDDDFLARITNTFIVRHPAAVIASLSRLKPDATSDEFGFRPLKQLFDRTTGDLQQAPIVVDGDRFRADPARVLRSFCAVIGVDFCDDMLTWDTGAIRPWLPHEAESQAKWHQTLESSTHILPPVAPPDIPAEYEHLRADGFAAYRDLVAHAL